MKNSRLSSIDLLRTIAIIIMIIANSSPYILELPHSIWLRLISSLAAPLFIFLSGYSFFISFKNNQNYSQKFLQIFYLFITAILIDIIIWNISPFQTFDVLYLIAFGLIVNTIIFKTKLYVKFIIALSLILVSFLLQDIFEYRFRISDPNIEKIGLTNMNIHPIFEIKRFFLDGWFPLLPWLGIAILGQIIAAKSEMFYKHKKFFISLSCVLLIIFGGLIITQESYPQEREGYLELFYPPSILFISFGLSFIFVLLSVFNNLEFINFSKYKIITILGRNSLLIYVFHTAIISFIFQKYLSELSTVLFAVMMLIFIILCMLIAFLSEWISKNGFLKFIPSPFKSVLGMK